MWKRHPLGRAAQAPIRAIVRAPRPYQTACFDAGRDAFRAGLRHIIFVLATGLGKTVIFVLIAIMVRAKGGRVLILVNRDVLTKQAAAELTENGMHPTIECAGDKASPLSDLVVGSIQTMASGNRIEKWNRDHFRMVICDECHGSSAATFAKVLDYFESAFHVGVTATPNRHDKKGLWKGYEKIVFEMPLKERTVDGVTVPGGIEEGWLCDLVFKPVPVPITLSDKAAKCRSMSEDDEAGDYGIGPFMEEIIEKSIDEYRGMKVLNFFPNCTSSKESAEAYKRAGLNARHVEGPGGPAGMSPKQIQETIEWFKGEREAMLCNAQLLSVGYNQPDINVIGLTRIIKSETTYLQSLGRGTRTVANIDQWADGTALDRRCAIQFSEKPFCKVVDLLIQNDEHNLCEPAMLITDDKEEREYIRSARKSGMQIDLSKVDEMIRAKRATDREKALAKMTDAIANAAAKAGRIGDKKFGPFLGHIMAKPRQPGWKPASPKQISFLQRLGYNGIAPSGWHAMRIIDAYLAHKAQS